MATKVLILLQENSGKVPLPDNVSADLAEIVYSVIDSLAETFEDLKSSLQGAGKYKHVVLLTDAACTRKNLLNTLVHHAKRGRVIDLVVLGHGTTEILVLNDGQLTGGKGGNIRSLRKDAKKRGCPSLNLRMVYMCNCYASTLNDDWRKVGAKASVGSIRNDYMPEPMATFFMHNWLSGQTAKDAAKNGYSATIPFFTPVYVPTVIQKYKNKKVSYPCGFTGFPPKPKFCKKIVRVPNGVKYKTNQKIIDSELVVSGNARF